MNAIRANVLALIAAAVGGVIGYCAFFWMATNGFYGLVLPGAAGAGSGAFKNRSIFIAIVCGLAALALGFFTEWRFAPFVADGSLGYFITHIYQLHPTTLIMIAVGAAIGFWVPLRRYEKSPATQI